MKTEEWKTSNLVRIKSKVQTLNANLIVKFPDIILLRNTKPKYENNSIILYFSSGLSILFITI